MVESKRNKKFSIPRDSFQSRKFFELLRSIKTRGSKTKTEHIQKDLGMEKTSGSEVRTLLASAKKYGLITSIGREIHLTELGKEYFKADEETKKTVLIKAFLKIPVFKKFFMNRDFIGELPKFSKLKEVIKELTKDEKEKIPENYLPIATNVLKSNMDYLELNFQEIKDVAETLESGKSLEDIEKQENNGQIDQKSSDYHKGFEMGFFLRGILSKKDLDKGDLEKLKESTKELTNLQTEINRAIDQHEKGLLPKEKISAFANAYFKEALEKDFGTKVSFKLELNKEKEENNEEEIPD